MVTSDLEFTEKSPMEIVLIINKNQGSNEQKTPDLMISLSTFNFQKFLILTTTCCYIFHHFPLRL